MPAARVIEEESWERDTPVFENPHQAPALNVGGHAFFERNEREPQSFKRCPNHEWHVVDQQRTGHIDREFLAELLKLPAIDTSRAQAVADALVVGEFARRLRDRVPLEVAWCANDRRPLIARHS